MSNSFFSILLIVLLASLKIGCGGSSDSDDGSGEPQFSGLDLARFDTDDGLIRVYGAAAEGRFGVPVSSGADSNGDGFRDYAMASFLASPNNRVSAGEIYLMFGDGTIGTTFDTAAFSGDYLIISGAARREISGSDIWLDDVNGDGIADILIGRQNFRASRPDRRGAGAVTIVFGGSVLRTLAASNEELDLADPPAAVTVLTIIGAEEFGRLGMRVRSGDITGDGVADLVVGADQEGDNRGAVYVVRGGAHLGIDANIDLDDFGSTPLAGHIAKLVPPAGSDGFHFGATLELADLDGNGRSEVLVAAALDRASAGLVADGAPAGSVEARGGAPGGRVYIAWDDNFPAGALWPQGLTIRLDNSAPGSISVLNGGTEAGVFSNEFFGEELLGGLDYNGDGEADLFVGDLRGDVLPDRADAGLGHIFFSAADLKDRSVDVDSPPANVRVTTLLGPQSGSTFGDAALHGDFDADGIDDLGVAAPLAVPRGREDAGVVHILWGRAGNWPERVDLRPGRQPTNSVLRITDILGARGQRQNDAGDTLGFNAAAGDLNNDGRDDVILSEMRGNGRAASAIDVGNLIVIDGAALAERK